LLRDGFTDDDRLLTVVKEITCIPKMSSVMVRAVEVNKDSMKAGLLGRHKILCTYEGI
jgi:hypothetical protein